MDGLCLCFQSFNSNPVEQGSENGLETPWSTRVPIKSNRASGGVQLSPHPRPTTSKSDVRLTPYFATPAAILRLKGRMLLCSRNEREIEGRAAQPGDLYHLD